MRGLFPFPRILGNGENARLPGEAPGVAGGVPGPPAPWLLANWQNMGTISIALHITDVTGVQGAILRGCVAMWQSGNVRPGSILGDSSRSFPDHVPYSEVAVWRCYLRLR